MKALRPKRCILVAAALTALLVLAYTAYPHASAQIDSVGASGQFLPTPTTVPTATVVPSVPSASALLSRATKKEEAKGSVLEYGIFTSTDNKIFDGFTFSATFSWRTKTFQDHHAFMEPIYASGDLGYVNALHRIAAGLRIATKTYGVWTCNRVTASQNAALWQPPSFALESARIMAAPSRNGHAVWDVRGTLKHGIDGRSTDLQVDVFIDQPSGMFVNVRERGSVSSPTGGLSRIAGSITYARFGKPVHIVVPAACRRHAISFRRH